MSLKQAVLKRQWRRAIFWQTSIKGKYNASKFRLMLYTADAHPSIRVGQGVWGIQQLFKSGIRYIYIIFGYLGYLNFVNFRYKVSHESLLKVAKTYIYQIQNANICSNLYL